VVRGSATKRLLIRGVGSSLAAHGVSRALDWGAGIDAAQLPAAAATAGTFPLTNSKDAALIVSLPAGIYTMQLSGKASAQGIGMLEVYELPAAP
jgi:hypothetical protein